MGEVGKQRHVQERSAQQTCTGKNKGPQDEVNGFVYGSISKGTVISFAFSLRFLLSDGVGEKTE